jgi:hypothetical protein
MTQRTLLRLILAATAATLLCSCGVGSRGPDDPFFKVQDAKLAPMQLQTMHVIEDTNSLKNHLHPILDSLQYIVLGLIGVFSALVALFQGLQDKAGAPGAFRRAIIVFGIVSALLSGGSIVLQKAKTAQNELTNAISAYGFCVDTFLSSADDVIIRKGNFNDPEDFNQLVKSYDEFNQKIMGVNVAFKDNVLIHSLNREAKPSG